MRATMKVTAFATLAAFALVTGCNDGRNGQPPGPSDGTNPMMDNNPDNPNPTPTLKASYSGVYEVVAPVDFTQNGVLPGMLSPILAALANVHDHPGQAIVTALAGANIPGISSILSKIPSFLMSLLTSKLDDLIKNQVYMNNPAIDQITWWIMGISEISQHIDVTDDITIHTPQQNGQAVVEQQLTKVGFTALGVHQEITISPAAKAQGYYKGTGQVSPRPNAPVADADMTLATATVGMPIGDLMLQALGPILFSAIGGAPDLKTALSNLFDCTAIGQALSDALGGVITPADGATLCTTGMGLVADQITMQIQMLSFSGVQLTNSKGVLYDVSPKKPTMDHQSDRIGDGTWTWQFGTVNVPSTLAGDRIADAM